jgi:autophagy-related protein 33
LTLPTASSASKAFTNLTVLSLAHIRTLASISSGSFLLAYILSPRSQKHPYLLWTTLFVASSGCTEYFLRFAVAEKAAVGTRKNNVRRDKKGKGRQMDASYEVLGAASDRESEGTASGEEMEEDVNGEEVRQQMEGFMMTQVVRMVVAGIGFAMSVVGIWGDGAADLVIIEM